MLSSSLSFSRMLLVFLFLASFLLVRQCDGFGPLSRGSSTKKSPSPLAEEAVGLYPFQFRPDNQPRSRASPITEITKAQALKAFNEMARIYGDESALKMVRTKPVVLGFNAENFQPTLDNWSEQFDEEAAKDMVKRNPGLLGIPPYLAEEDANATMALSYLVAVPLPVWLLAWLLAFFLLVESV